MLDTTPNIEYHAPVPGFRVTNGDKTIDYSSTETTPVGYAQQPCWPRERTTHSGYCATPVFLGGTNENRIRKSNRLYHRKKAFAKAKRKN